MAFEEIPYVQKQGKDAYRAFCTISYSVMAREGSQNTAQRPVDSRDNLISILRLLLQTRFSTALSYGRQPVSDETEQGWVQLLDSGDVSGRTISISENNLHFRLNPIVPPTTMSSCSTFDIVPLTQRPPKNRSSPYNLLSFPPDWLPSPLRLLFALLYTDIVNLTFHSRNVYSTIQEVRPLWALRVSGNRYSQASQIL